MAGIIGFKRPLHSGRPSYDRAGSLQGGTGNVCHLKPEFSTDPLSNRNPRDQEHFDEHRRNHPASSSNRGLYHRNRLFAISLARLWTEPWASSQTILQASLLLLCPESKCCRGGTKCFREKARFPQSGSRLHRDGTKYLRHEAMLLHDKAMSFCGKATLPFEKAILFCVNVM